MTKDRSDKSKSRHHYVQKAYLNGFAVNEKIDVINREDGTVRITQRTSSVANERGLYTIQRENGDKDGILEDIFAEKVESPAIKIIRNMTSVLPYVPRQNERQVIAEYMALQYLRTPEAKRRFEAEAGRFEAIEIFNMANDSKKVGVYLGKKGEKNDNDSVAAYRDKVIKSLHDNEIIPNSTMWYRQIIKSLPHIADIMTARYGWHLLYYDDPVLLTGDHPVILRQIRESWMGTGFMNADEIIFPLNVRYALLLSTDFGIKEQVNTNANPSTAKMINWYVKRNSYMEVYSHPSLTSEYAGEALGQKILTETTGMDMQEIGFLNNYSGVLLRKKPMR
ncbi:MAG: DUF4238 domain-containing protein [Candidatus Saccharimonadales bacterium]